MPNELLEMDLGPANTGLAASLQYRVLEDDGTTEHATWSGTGVVEVDATDKPGYYRVQGAIDIPTDGGFIEVQNSSGSVFFGSVPVIPTASSAPTAAEIRAEMDSNSTQLAAIVADTNELQTDWADAGRLDAILDARASQSSVDTVDSNVDAILADTGTDGVVVSSFTTAAKAEVNAEADTALTDYDPPTKAELDSGLAGLNDLSAAEVNAEVDTALADYDPPTKAELDSGLAGLNDLSASEVNAEVVDALITDTYAEPSSVPGATSSLKDKINWLFTLARNRVTQTSSTQTLRNDANSANIGTASTSDDGSTFTRGEWS